VVQITTCLEKEFFETILPASGTVILGDGTTTLSIQGIGTVKCKVGSATLIIPNVRYIPDLSESICSLFQHIKTPDHGLDSTFEDGLYLKFPGFQTKALIGIDDIYLDMLPLSSSEYFSRPSEHKPPTGLPMYCRNIIQPNSEQLEPITKGNILQDLGQYYNEVTTKRQLGLDVPAGFRTNSAHTKQYLLYTPPRKSANIQPCETDSASHDNITIDQLSMTPLHSNCSLDLGLLSNTDPVSDTSMVPFIPIIRSVDKPSSSLPKNISMSEDYLRSCVGFHRIDTLKKHLLQLYQPTVTLDHTPPDAILDPGC